MRTTESCLIKDEGVRLMELAPICWEAEVDKMVEADANEVSRWLDSVAERIARLSAYVSARKGSGCGDSGHRFAMKEQNKVARKVRRALGYQITVDLSF